VEVTGQLSNHSVAGLVARLHLSLTSRDQVLHPHPKAADATVTPSPPRRRQRCLSDDQVRSLVEAYKAGIAINELAAEFHVHRSTVLDHLNRAGTKRRHPAVDSHQVEEAAQLRGAGKSFRDIGRHFGVHASTVRQHLVRGLQ
jgi:DNA-binding CsgD family transcriptional regulator